MSAPKRIQMTRNRPWRADNPDAVIVARPSKWGNPFKAGGFFINRGPWADAPYPTEGPERTRETRTAMMGHPYTEIVAKVVDRQHAVDLFRAHIAYENIDWAPADIRRLLAGRDLACWCPLDQPCHADVLLTLANGDTP